MDNLNRGRILCPERASQLMDFSGLRYGMITPTNVDGLIEFKDRLYVLLELKLRKTSMKRGQELCFERLCNALTAANKIAVIIVAEHDTPIGQQISCADANVRKCYIDGKWIAADTVITVGELVNIFYEKYIGKIPA